MDDTLGQEEAETLQRDDDTTILAAQEFNLNLCQFVEDDKLVQANPAELTMDADKDGWSLGNLLTEE
ncbi:unnamed protein product [Peronospora farinosa]|uniref:Uncharacterized protein n=1 Tax=Peronospora farinosa TaxID=134698 RepID=A0AAV0SVX8_9STRA|nr:unnamed protein product [Peronospora farinosa]